MPPRLIGGFDQRWRDTPVKSSSRLFRLYLFVFLSSSIPIFSPSIALSFLTNTSNSLICPTSCLALLSILIPPPPSLLTSCKNLYNLKGQCRRLVSTMLRLIPAPQVVALSCPQEQAALDIWRVALHDTHHTHETGNINKHSAHTNNSMLVHTLIYQTNQIQTQQKLSKTNTQQQLHTVWAQISLLFSILFNCIAQKHLASDLV